MLQKKNPYFSNWILVIGIVLLIVILSVFRLHFLNIYNSYLDFNILGSGNEQTMLTKNERDELENLRVENRTLKNILSDLKEEINLIQDGLEPTYVKMLSKTFIDRVASNYYGTFYVTYPKDKSVYKGMNIYSHGNVLVGTVEEVLENSLFVNRIGQNKTFLAMSAEADEEFELGSLSKGLFIGSIAAKSKISVGDQIVLKGFPKSVIGVVSEIKKVEGSVSTIFVRSPYNTYNKEIFYVLE